jgi:hypothetical protein
MSTERPRLFMFRSGSNDTLFGFASDAAGTRLPEKFSPWTSIGVVRGDQKPPHGLKREAIENGIAEFGFQLWRKKEAVAKTA